MPSLLPYVTPVWAIEIGDWVVRRLVRFDVCSSRISPVDVAEIEVDRIGFPLVDVGKGDPVKIWQGYREHGLWQIFGGTVQDIIPGKTVVVSCHDAMRDLSGVRLSQSYTSIVPQEIIRSALAKANVTRYRISARVLPPRRQFVALGESVTEILKRVNRTWSLEDWSFYFDPEGEFWWGPWEESDRYLKQGDLTVLALGQNLLDHQVQKDEQEGVFETVAMPWLRHSHRVVLRDGRFWSGDKTVRLDRIHYHHSKEKARFRAEWSLPKAS